MSPPTTSHSQGQSSIGAKMLRQDSGYESQFPSSSPRQSVTHSQRAPSQRLSNSSLKRSRTRPPTHSSSTGSQASITHAYPARSSTTATITPSQQQAMAMLQFTSPDLSSSDVISLQQEEPASIPLPQTTHYWTSDSTRRMEYAAIDAAGKGFRGWMRKHVLPDCLTGREKHLAFDDDSGSVRRYRLELADEDDGDFENDVEHEKLSAKKRTFTVDSLASSISGVMRTKGRLNLRHAFVFKP